jgi:mRNA-degrading endonuclease RelE of RelBE toxin-antitoxin system
LSTFPGRCPLAPENDDFTDRPVRQCLYRNGRVVYRILYDIVDEDTVRVLHVRHASQGLSGNET